MTKLAEMTNTMVVTNAGFVSGDWSGRGCIKNRAPGQLARAYGRWTISALACLVRWRRSAKIHRLTPLKILRHSEAMVDVRYRP